MDHRAKSRGTTRAQWIVLFRLREQEGLSQVDLADVLELQQTTVVMRAQAYRRNLFAELERVLEILL